MLQEQVMYTLVEYSSSEVLDVITFTDYESAKANMIKEAYHAIIKAQEQDIKGYLQSYRGLSHPGNCYWRKQGGDCWRLRNQPTSLCTLWRDIRERLYG